MAQTAVIADIHSNLEAFKKVIGEINKRGIKKIYCCGDIVGYGAEQNECVNLIKKHKIISIKGNHDVSCISLQDKDLFNEYGRAGIEYGNKTITEENKQFLFNLSTCLGLNGICFVHGSPINRLWEYVYPDSPLSKFKNFFKKTKAGILVMGHTHIPFIKRIKDNLAVNPGSVGQPRDGDKRASFCILDPETKEAEIIRIDYNIKKTACRIKKAGLPDFTAERLFSGF
jgi:putative phosphoesterase